MTTVHRPSEGMAIRAPSRLAGYVLLMLFLANVLAYVDRSVVAMIVEPLKAELHLSDSAIGLLTGFAFVTFYSLFGFPFARWADTGVRRNILALGVMLWSGATLLCGTAGNFWQMALARTAVGVGEAAGTPPSLSLIADYYRNEDRPQAISFFRAAPFVAAIMGIPFTGWITEAYGWRATFFAFGALGLPLALLIRLSVPEPVRGALDADAGARQPAPPLRETARIMFSHRPFVLLFTGMAIYGVSSSIGGTWVPAFLMRVHGLTPSQVGALVGPVLGVTALVGTLAGGIFATRLMRRGQPDRLILGVLLLAALLAVPMQAAFVLDDSLFWALFWGAGASFLGALKLGPFMALMLSWMPAGTRGVAAAMILLATSLLPGGIAPLLVGLVSDALSAHSGGAALRYAMVLQPVTLLLGTVICALALRDLPRTPERR